MGTEKRRRWKATRKVPVPWNGKQQLTRNLSELTPTCSSSSCLKSVKVLRLSIFITTSTKTNKLSKLRILATHIITAG